MVDTLNPSAEDLRHETPAAAEIQSRKGNQDNQDRRDDQIFQEGDGNFQYGKFVKPFNFPVTIGKTFFRYFFKTT